MSTHELDLPAEIATAKICITRSINWTATGTIQSWDVDVIESAGAIPEDLRTDLLGSRRKIVFTEGTDTSLDRPMYAVLFPETSVYPKESCREVIRAVVGLRSAAELHRAEAYGLIDSDGMSACQIAAHRAQNIYALGMFAVESLYYAPELLRAVAQRQAETANADSHIQTALVRSYLDDAKSKGLAAIAKGNHIPHLASRIAERQLRDGLNALLPTRKAMIAGDVTPIAVNLPSPYPAELARLQGLIESGNLDGIISRYPVRETPAPDEIAKALGFRGRADYEAAALARVASNKTLLAAMRDKLQPLSTKLL